MTTPIKSILLSVFATVAVFSSTIYYSCNKDQCKATSCAHGAVCDKGKCLCTTGYGGANCEVLLRQKFLGTWQVYEKGSATNPSQYNLIVTGGAGITDVQIKNFYNYFTTPIYGHISGANGDTLIIENQQLQGKLTFGKGYITSNNTYGVNGQVTMAYEIIDTSSNYVNDFGYYEEQDHSSPSQWNIVR